LSSVRFTLVISSLSGGGAERVLSIMANYWAKAAHQITLLTFDDKSTPHYNISESIQWHAIDIKSQSSSWIRGVLKQFETYLSNT